MAQSLKLSFSRVKLTFLCGTVTHRSFPALCAENPCLGSCLSWLLLSHKTNFFFPLLNLNFLPMNGLNLDAGRSSKRKLLSDGDGSRALTRTGLLAGICSGYCLSRVEHPTAHEAGIVAFSVHRKVNSLREVV